MKEQCGGRATNLVNLFWRESLSFRRQQKYSGRECVLYDLSLGLSWSIGMFRVYQIRAGISNTGIPVRDFSYRYFRHFHPFVCKLSQKFLNVSAPKNTLTASNDHTSLSGMRARHQTGVWTASNYLGFFAGCFNGV